MEAMKSDPRCSGSPGKWREQFPRADASAVCSGSWGLCGYRQDSGNRRLGKWWVPDITQVPRFLTTNAEPRGLGSHMETDLQHRFLLKRFTLPQSHTFQGRKQVRKAPGIAPVMQPPDLEGDFYSHALATT